MALTTVLSTGISSLPAISAANLTSIPAANITGTLPAISGANLTGISAGKIGQVITQTLAPSQSSVSATSYTGTSFSIDITPSATTSKIYVTFDCGGVYHSTSAGGLIRVRYNDDTTIFNTGTYTAYKGGSDIQIGSSCAILHSPSTTSQKNYKIEIRNRAADGVFYIGHPNNSDTYGTFTCMEVLA